MRHTVELTNARTDQRLTIGPLDSGRGVEQTAEFWRSGPMGNPFARVAAFVGGGGQAGIDDKITVLLRAEDGRVLYSDGMSGGSPGARQALEPDPVYPCRVRLIDPKEHEAIRADERLRSPWFVVMVTPDDDGRLTALEVAQ